MRAPCVVHYREIFPVYSETFIRETVTRHRRYEPVMLTHERISNGLNVDVRVAELPAGRRGSSRADWSDAFRIARRSRMLTSALQQLRPAVLHAHFGEEGVTALAAARTLGIPLVVSFYGYDATELAQRLLWRVRFRWLLRHAAAILAEGPHMAARLETLGAPAARVVVHPIPVRLELFAFRPPAIPRDGEQLVVLQACRFIEKKGVDVTIAAFARIAPHVPSAVLWLMGRGPDEARLRTLAAATGIAERIRFVPAASHQEYADMMRQAHVFVHPSRTAPSGDGEGGAPTALLEAQAMGLPIVASTHADIPNVVDADAALLAPPGDIDALATLLQRMLQSPHEWAARAQAGRSQVVARHDPDVLAGRLEDLYDHVRR